MDKAEARREELRHKTFVLMVQVLFIFGIPAVLAYFIGSWADTTYDIRPNGSIISAIVALAISWTLTIRNYKKLKKQFKELEKEDSKEE